MTKPIGRRSLLTLALAAPTSLIVAPPGHATSPVTVQRIKFADAMTAMSRASDASTTGTTYTTGPLATQLFRVAGLTWRGSTDATARIRLRTGGVWSMWSTVVADEHYPEAGGPDAETARSGTAPIIVAPSDGIEVEVNTLTEVPGGLFIELIDPGVAPLDSDPGPLPHAKSLASPYIRSRAKWGADESVRESGKPEYHQVRGAFVHHTAGSNRYSKSDVPGIIRGIYAYHVNGRGWRDIGYNFLVDKFGRIWEGRYGGITKAVVGAHAYGYNRFAFGAAVLGTYSGNQPPTAVLNAFSKLIAWKFDVHGVDPRRVSYPDLKDVPAIAGHRDGGATLCPGDKLYAMLSVVRGGVADKL